MGVTGAGKTTIGRMLAGALGVAFLDADDYHDATSIAKMRAGTPLSDADRGPWLARLNHALREHRAGAVIAASVLTTASRRALVDGVEGVRYVVLTGDPATIDRRLAERTGHFAGPALLPSQLALFDPPSHAVVVDVGASPAVVAARALAGLRRGPGTP
jgi:gluconokinase